MENWLSDCEWARVQAVIPIVCVDVLPIRLNQEATRVDEIGLILRDTPHEGSKWCTIGGRVLYGEALHDAFHREIKNSLGHSVTYQMTPGAQPVYVAQYSPNEERLDAFDAYDPRKHAIGLTYGCTLDGDVTPCGEAIDFSWFSLDEIPNIEFGFNQGSVIRQCLAALHTNWLGVIRRDSERN